MGLHSVLGSIQLAHWIRSIEVAIGLRVCGLLFSQVLACAFCSPFSLFVLFGERFYEGLISILDLGVYSGR